jgi:sortase A
MRRKFGTFFIILGILALLGAAALMVYNLNEEQQAGTSSGAVLEELTVQITEPTRPVSRDPESSTEAPTQPPQLEIPNYLLNPEMDLPVKISDGREYVGILTIPALDLELPILTEWSRAGAKIAPCRYTGTPYLKNMVLCAHNYNSHFGRLNTLKIGDLVYFMDMEGNLFTYEVGTFEILQPNQVEPMVSSQWDLTLFTCTLGGQTRFVVRCQSLE